jgi:CHAD domain-containing protein
LNNPEYYVLGDSIDRKDLSERISADFKAIFERSVKQKKRYLDTFDFRLCNEGLYLLCDEKSFILHNSHFDKPIAELSASGKKEPKFWWELPSCPLRQELKQRIEVRALLPIMEIEKITTPVRILNDDEKTVLNLTLEDIKVVGNNGSTITHLCLRPVRGYGRELNEFKSYLAKLSLKESQGDYLKALLSSIGKDPKDFSSKLNIKLTPELSSLEALIIIMKDLLRTIKLNENGILKDIDIEFLHDFRVAVRRTRSALSQIKGVFPDDVTEKFKEDFSNLGKMTNLLRDLDIYLLDKDRYRAMLPEELSPGLEHMFSMFKEERKRAHKDIVKTLKSKEYRKTIESWERFLNEPQDIIPTPNSEVPVIEMAGRIIKKRYKRILRDGSRINEATPDAELHQLRIECKKLRYMIEFFSSLYPEDDIKTLVRHLKKLQDNLGEFNDLSVQRASLKAFIDKLEPSNEKQRDCIVSSGGLISMLFERQKEVRSQFTEKFMEFQDKETKSIFRKLFYVKGESIS